MLSQANQPVSPMDKMSALGSASGSPASSALITREYQRKVEDLMREGVPQGYAERSEIKNLNDTQGGQYPTITPGSIRNRTPGLSNEDSFRLDSGRKTF
jgi:hypothetical protein